MNLIVILQHLERRQINFKHLVGKNTMHLPALPALFSLKYNTAPEKIFIKSISQTH